MNIGVRVLVDMNCLGQGQPGINASVAAVRDSGLKTSLVPPTADLPQTPSLLESSTGLEPEMPAHSAETKLTEAPQVEGIAGELRIIVSHIDGTVPAGAGIRR